MTIYDLTNLKTGENKKYVRLDSVYAEIKNITGNEKTARRYAEWAENARQGQKKTSLGKLTVTVGDTKEEFTK